MPRELPPPDELLKPRDRAPIIYVPAYIWNCTVCAPMEPGESFERWSERVSGSPTTVNWRGVYAPGLPAGRCTDCGQKYELARAYESVPAPEDQRWPR